MPVVASGLAACAIARLNAPRPKPFVGYGSFGRIAFASAMTLG